MERSIRQGSLEGPVLFNMVLQLMFEEVCATYEEEKVGLLNFAGCEGMLDNVNIDIRTQVYHHKYLRSRQNAVSSTSKPGPTKINLDTRDLPPL
ncbi:unnamed protein product [Hymenolepis diminuta]|uniref:Reverse transcriptase domain-containing protein n=1 Tax=Hymenolepis diminuta TaxID=6216 RepID=A0A0R3SIT6_HYMDI|nr:unnamed protein product [Hymenolepis diminuta]